MVMDLQYNQISKKEVAKELLRRRNARNHLLDFTTFTKSDYVTNWHHKLICEKLDKFVSGEIKRLIVCMPPQNGKSELVSRRLPAFLFGKNPNCRIISCSYSADLAQRMNRDVQRIVSSPEYATLFPDVSLNESNVRTTAQGGYLRNSDIFEIVGHEGVYRSCGIGGGITGMSMDYGIVDDYLKNREEAESLTIRNKIYEWYTDVLSTREQGNSSILITATRWSEDDLIGRLLDKAEKDPDADQWEVITLPAMAEEVRPDYDIRTGEGQALWEEEFSLDDLLTTKASLTPYEWLSLYQQRPSAAAGNLVKKEQFKYCHLVGDVIDLGGTKQYLLSQCRVFQTCDPANSTKTSADYFVLATWVQTPDNDLALVDLIRTRLESPDQVPLCWQQYKKWSPFNIGFKFWVESNGGGKSLVQYLQREGLPVEELHADTDKLTRFIPAATRIASGCVYFISNNDNEESRGIPWLHDFEAELLGFPNAAHDDQVDVLSYAALVVIDNPFRNEKIDLTKMFRTRAR